LLVALHTNLAPIYFRGEILKTPVGDDWHFYNRVAGRVCDFAAEQFSELPAYLNIPSSRDEALAGSARECYQALAALVNAALGNRHGVLGMERHREPALLPNAPSEAGRPSSQEEGRREFFKAESESVAWLLGISWDPVGRKVEVAVGSGPEQVRVVQLCLVSGIGVI